MGDVMDSAGAATDAVHAAARYASKSFADLVVALETLERYPTGYKITKAEQFNNVLIPYVTKYYLSIVEIAYQTAICKLQDQSRNPQQPEVCERELRVYTVQGE